MNESDFTVGRYHFNLKLQGKDVMNPSTWTLETWISINRKEVDSRAKITRWLNFHHPRTAKDGQKFVKLSLLANEYVISSIQVSFSDQKELKRHDGSVSTTREIYVHVKISVGRKTG